MILLLLRFYYQEVRYESNEDRRIDWGRVDTNDDPLDGAIPIGNGSLTGLGSRQWWILGKHKPKMFSVSLFVVAGLPPRLVETWDSNVPTHQNWDVQSIAIHPTKFVAKRMASTMTTIRDADVSCWVSPYQHSMNQCSDPFCRSAPPKNWIDGPTKVQSEIPMVDFFDSILRATIHKMWKLGGKKK